MSRQSARSLSMAAFGLVCCLGFALPQAAAQSNGEAASASEKESEAYALDSRRFIEQGQWPEAWEAAHLAFEGQNDPESQRRYARLRLDTLYYSGDLARTLALAEKLAPKQTDPYARYLAAQVALTLDMELRAEEHLDALRAALSPPDPHLVKDTVDWYKGALQDLRKQQAKRRQVRKSKEAAIERSRWVVGLAVLGLLAGALVLGFKRTQ